MPADRACSDDSDVHRPIRIEPLGKPVDLTVIFPSQWPRRLFEAAGRTLQALDYRNPFRLKPGHKFRLNKLDPAHSGKHE
jgi:hypothetical protein